MGEDFNFPITFGHEKIMFIMPLMIPRIVNIRGIFTMNKILFIVEKGSLDYY